MGVAPHPVGQASRHVGVEQDTYETDSRLNGIVANFR